jgi:hypothetical protein
MIFKKTLAWILLSCLFLCASAQSDNQRALAAMKNAIGNILDHYSVYSYPTNNFGVGTSCRQRWFPKGPMVCDMVDCLGLDQVSSNERLWKTVNGYAHYGSDGGPLTLEDSLTRAYGLGLLLPKILQVLGVNVNLDSKRSRSVHLTIDSAVLRTLNYDKYKAFILSGKNQGLKDAYDAHRLLVATSDFVLLNYSLEVDRTDTFGATLSAKLDSLLKAGLGGVLNGKDSLGLQISRRDNSTFKISSGKPVVFAVYIMKQKNLYPEGLETVHDFKDPHSEYEEVEATAFIENPK